MATQTTVNHLRLVGAAGTNKVMAGELSRLAARASLARRLGTPRKEGTGALVYPFDAEVAALAVRYHRTSVRVLWDLFQSSATRLEPLYADLRDAVAADSRVWLGGDASLTVHAYGVREFAAGERQIVGTVKNAIVDGAAERGYRVRVEPQEPQLHVSVRLYGGRVTVSLDLAGRPMNQRGYRTTGGAAPLREDLAAVLVMLARYDARRELLLDPMAGSGTIAIEAASMGQAKPLWIAPRRPACAELRPFSPGWENEAPALFADTRPVILANDVDATALELCRRHLSRAGCEAWVHPRQGDFRHLHRREVAALCKSRQMEMKRGLILSNPPYGERLEGRDMGGFYRSLGIWCRQFHGWRAAFLVAHGDFERHFGLRPRIKKPLNNGPLRGYFLLYEL